MAVQESKNFNPVDPNNPDIIAYAKKIGSSRDAIVKDPKQLAAYKDYLSDPRNYKTYAEYQAKQQQYTPKFNGYNGEKNMAGMDVSGQPMMSRSEYMTSAGSGGGGTGSDARASIDDLQNKYAAILAGGQTVRDDGTLAANANVYEQPEVDATGKPLKHAFISLIDPKTGLLRQEYQLKDSLDRTGIDAFRKEALREGPSTWATLQKTAQQDALSKSSNAQAANAQSQLAMSGGLASGSAERLAKNSANQALLGGQGIAQNIAVQDETNRLQMLQALPQADLAVAGYSDGITKYNVGNALNEGLQQRAYNSNNYNEAMKAWGSEKTAQASSNSGGGKK